MLRPSPLDGNTAVAPVAAVPAITTVAALPPEGASSVQGTADRQSSGNFIWSNDGEKISIKYDGAFEIDDQDSGIKSISPGGFLHVSDGDGHLVEFTADRRDALDTLQGERP